MKQYLVAIIMAAGIVGCTSSERAEMKQDTKDAAAETRARTSELASDANAKRKEYQERMQARLDKIDREMEEERLKAKGRKMTAKQRREYNQRMTEFDELKADTRRQWNELKDSTDDNWEKFKDSMDRAGDKLESGWNSFVADLKS